MDAVISQLRTLVTDMGESGAALTRTSGEIATKLAEYAAAEQTGNFPTAPSTFPLPDKVIALRAHTSQRWRDRMPAAIDDFEEALMTRDWEEMLVKTVAMPCPVRRTSVAGVEKKPKVAAISEEDITSRIAEVAAKLRDEYNKKSKDAFEKGRSEAKAEHKKELLEMQQQLMMLTRQKQR